MRRNILFFIIILFISCNNRTKFEEKHIQKQIGEDCQQEACISIDLYYLYCSKGNESFVDNFNQTISSKTISLILQSLPEEYNKKENPSTIQQAADIFLQSYKESKEKDFEPEYFSGAELTLADSISLDNSKFVSIKRETLAFLGGVHGSYQTLYYNFDIKNGQLLSNNQLFTNLAEVTKVAEKHFREQTEMAPGKSFDEEGFWFDDDTFTLSKNIGFDNKNMILYYNPYEIAPYSMGPTTIYIPISEIKQWLTFF